MKIAPFEIKEYIFFRKTREKMFYKLTELKLNTIEKEIDHLRIEGHYLKPGKCYEELCANISENIAYLEEIKKDIVYYRLHGKMRTKKHSLYSKYYQYNRA